MSRVAIVYPRANVDTVPSLVGSAEALAEHGYDVDLFTTTSVGQPAPCFNSPRVHLRSLGTDGQADLDKLTVTLRGAARSMRWLPHAAHGPLLRSYRALGAGLAHGSRLAARARAALPTEPIEPYRCVIGVDPDGLALATSLAQGAPLAYYSLELLLSYELTTSSEERLKVRERELSLAAPFVIIQDEDRARLLADDNGIPAERMVLVPNAPSGPARRAASRYWHERFGLSASTRVAVHAGSLGDWTGIERIVESVATWPVDWALVVHTRYDAGSSSYVDALRRRADPERVHFSLRPVSRQEYDVLVDGADAGLAFYVSTPESAFTQRNVRTIGLSSGKLAYYLRAGLPVIINRDASIAPLVESSGCGIVVEDASHIGAGLSSLAASYDQRSAAACAFFTDHLDFRRGFERVLRRVDALPGVR